MPTSNPRPLARPFFRWRSLIVLGVGLLVQGAGTAAAAKGEPDGKCTIQNVAGAYGVLGSGTALQNAAGLPEGLGAPWAF